MISKLSSRFLAAAMVWLCLAQQPGHTQPQAPPIGRPAPTAGYLREMRCLDTDGDRRVSPKELAAGQHMASMLLMLSWDECDLDYDGAMSLGEFQLAAEEAMQVLRETNTEAAQQAQDALAKAVTMRLLLEQLSREEQYAAEIAALRAEIRDMNDDEAVVTYIIKYPTRYPRLVPVVRTWVRHYPVHPRLHKVVRPYGIRAYRPSTRATPVHPAKARPRTGTPPPKKAARPGRRPHPRRP